MNILLINHYAGSPEMGMEFRPYYLAREWKRLGHNVTIIGASCSHLRIKQPCVEKKIEVQDIEGINYLWIKTRAYHSTIPRIMNMLQFIYTLQCKASWIAKKYSPDLVITSSTYPLDNYPASKIAKLSNARLVYEVHDLWPLSPMLIGGYKKWHPFIAVMQRAENFAYKHVDKVVSLLWNAEEHMKEHGLAEGKFIFTPNGYVPEEWEESNFEELPNLHKTSLEKIRDSGFFIVGFAGGLTPSTAMQTFIDAAYLLTDQNNIVFVLVGDGPSKRELEQKAADFNLQNVLFLPKINKNAIPTLIKYFDVAYAGGTRSILHQYGTSFNKIADYMLSKKPIVFSVDEPNSMVERVGCGIRVEAENAQEVANAIKTIYNLNPLERIEMGKKGREYALQHLSYPILARQMLTDIMK